MNVYGPAWAEIDLDAIAYNVHQIKEFVSNNKKNTEILAVVKADGYGHGAVEVAKTMEENGIDKFGVATVYEGIELRKAGIKKSILVLSYTPEIFVREALENNLTLTIYSIPMAKHIELMGKELGVLPRVHIKIDTGMSRLGFLPQEETIDKIKTIVNLSLDVEGIFSHFAKADSKDKTPTHKQAEKFIWILSKLEENGINIRVKHICNSAAMMELPEYYFDMVRAGGILYGHCCLLGYLDKSPIPVKQALSIRAVISNINEYGSGTGVSYGWLYITDRKQKIASICIGYTDGINRKNSNHAEFLFKGKKIKQIGLICMDQMMVDVTDIADIKIGDVITLLGRDGDDVITLEERADSASIGKSELLAGIGRRLPKVYIKNTEKFKIINYLINEHA
ncbi:alanine racemase [Wukongibacter baidiensis]|uniref:alanine racemase n=1 Tax=Wukongibacter baidiensis TaxID=1723361 RepID=UPI003D7F8880